MWLRNSHKKSIDEELQRLQAQTAENPKDKKTVGLRDLFRDRATTRGLVISLGLLIAPATCGLFVVVRIHTYYIELLAEE